MDTIRIIGEGDSYIHIHSPQQTIITLCGWSDVNHSPSQAKPTCPSCLQIVTYCKSLKVRKTTLVRVAHADEKDS
jgi:hypothetical protein